MLFAALRVESDTMGDFCIRARANYCTQIVWLKRSSRQTKWMRVEIA